MERNSDKPIPAHKRLPAPENKHWTDLELKRLVLGLKRFGKNYRKISEFVGTRQYLPVAIRIRDIVNGKQP